MEEYNNRDNSMKKLKKEQAHRKKLFRMTRTLFLVVLLVIGMIGLLFFLRPKTSEVENRALAAFPKLTFTGLMNGEFTEGISKWYADTFPLREGFARDQALLYSLRGFGTPAPTGYSNVKDSMPTVLQAVADQAEYERNKPLPDPYTPAVALTFDDGPSAENTPIILDALEKYNAHATFFVIGENAELHPELLKREAELGCEIGNHTWDHPYDQELTAEDVKEQMRKTDEVIEAATGAAASIMRPPGGAYPDVIKDNVGKALILWEVDTRDWQSHNVESIIDICMSTVSDGSIILMHDLYEESAQAAVQLIQKLQEAGYKLLTISELAELKGHTLQAGSDYFYFHYHPEDHLGDKYEESAGLEYDPPSYLVKDGDNSDNTSDGSVVDSYDSSHYNED